MRLISCGVILKHTTAHEGAYYVMMMQAIPSNTLVSGRKMKILTRNPSYIHGINKTPVIIIISN